MNVIKTFCGLLLVLLCGAAAAQAPAVRIRGVIEAFDQGLLTIRTREGGSVRVKLAEKASVSGVVPAPLSDLAAGKFIGTATQGEQDGARVALEVLVFPDAMKGTGEGHYGWDLKPESMMTNATIEGAVAAASGRVLTVRYKGGEQRILVPEGCPIVTFVPADASALKPGAHVFIFGAARGADGGLTAARISVGLNGLVPPM